MDAIRPLLNCLAGLGLLSPDNCWEGISKKGTREAKDGKLPPQRTTVRIEVGGTEIQPPFVGGGARGRKCNVKRRGKQCTEGFCNSPLEKQSWEASRGPSASSSLPERERKVQALGPAQWEPVTWAHHEILLQNIFFFLI